MWQVLESTEYFVKLITNFGSEVYVTDFTCIWYLHFSEEHFLKALKETNPILEMADVEFLQKGKEMLSVPKNYHNIQISKIDTKLVLSLVKRLPFKLKLELELDIGSKEMFFIQVTNGLLHTINDLKSSQLQLCTLLNKKDKEIDEYKSKGVEISARHLKTDKFNESDHLTRHKTYEDNFGASSLPGFLLKKMDEFNIKMELESQSIQVKQEPESQSSEVKTESLSLNSEVITQPESLNSEVKTLPQSLNNEVKIQSQSESLNSKVKTETLNISVTESNIIKKEEVKTTFSPSPKKKMKRLNL